MTRRKKDPLRTLTEEEQKWLERISRSYSEPATHVARAKEILAVAEGNGYTQAAHMAGRKSRDAVSQLVEQFNQEGIAAIQPQHGGGPRRKYTSVERIEWKGGALRLCRHTFPPSPLQTGRATRRCIRLSNTVRSNDWHGDGGPYGKHDRAAWCAAPSRIEPHVPFLS